MKLLSTARVKKFKVIKQTIVRSDHYPIKLILNLNKLSSSRSSDKEKETPKINNLSNLPITTRKINIREAMSTMVMMENNIDAITKEIYNHATKKLGTKSLTHSKRLFGFSEFFLFFGWLKIERRSLQTKPSLSQTHITHLQQEHQKWIRTDHV